MAGTYLGQRGGYSPYSTNCTLQSSDLIVQVMADNLTVMLPDATSFEAGSIYYINNDDVSNTTVVPMGGQNINNLSSYPIQDPFNGIAIYSNGLNWRTI